MATYATRQQKLILDALHRSGESLTAQALCDLLRADGHKLGLATVYRQLQKLEEGGSVHRIVTDGGSTYRYCDLADSGECFFIKCEKCGKMEHVDCSHMSELYEHLFCHHHFAVNPRRTMFYGLCHTCGEEAGR